MATLILPFRSLSDESFISRGSAGQVFAVSRDVVFKFPTRFHDPAPPQEEEMMRSIERIQHEMRIHEMLQKHRHPNIMHSILCIPEGFFMQRVDDTLQHKIAESDGSLQIRWIQQLTRGAAWLEGLGLAHGDLRPANILVDSRGNLRLTDFDACVRTGEQLIVASESFCKLNTDLETLPAGPQSEQYSLGSCIYNIRFRRIPFDDVDPPTRVRRLANSQYPSTSDDALYGEVIQRCWQGTYESIGSLLVALTDLHPNLPLEYPMVGNADEEDLLQQCKAFLEAEQ